MAALGQSPRRVSADINLSRLPSHPHVHHGLPVPDGLDHGTPVFLPSSRRPSPEVVEHQPRSGVAVANLKDVPPDGGYGWVCTFCVFMIEANTWGVNSCWGIFLDRYMTWDTFREATGFEYAMIGGLSISQALLVSPLTAALQKRIGTRLTMLLGAALVFAGVFSASAATQIWHLFLSFAFCFGWGMGLIYIPVSTSPLSCLHCVASQIITHPHDY
jgi:hypothetical protein